ncbi:hypothetical protein ACFS7Z_03615 [Pontibacter toksunensis]|uniref:Uncharacterized protein n=1 Tax=Pontibacter toksunensis TaxID=1332631 RepID=A0ABW6BR69_9BACT
MIQGKIIAMRPIALADDSHSGDTALTEEASYHNTCSGEVQILEGEYNKQIAHFNHEGRCCGKKVGEKVNLKILSTDNGKIMVDLTGC